MNVCSTLYHMLFKVDINFVLQCILKLIISLYKKKTRFLSLKIGKHFNFKIQSVECSVSLIFKFDDVIFKIFISLFSATNRVALNFF